MKSIPSFRKVKKSLKKKKAIHFIFILHLYIMLPVLESTLKEW